MFVMKKPGKQIFEAGSRALLPLILAFLSFMPSYCRAQEAAAVLSKGSGLYFDAFMVFQKALGRPVTPFDLSVKKPVLPGDLKAVVAFGSRAAAFEYPAGAKVIYLLSPGYTPRNAGGRFTAVSALPEPAQAVEAYKKLQPGLKRLAVFISKTSRSSYIAELSAAAKPRGVVIIPVALGGPGEFPDKLRALAGKTDAFWLLPEPALIDKTSLLVLADFSCSNKLPFYAPSGGLSEMGAAAAFAPGLDAVGAAAAAALEKALSGGPLPETIYVPHSEMTINGAFIKKCGLPVRLFAAEETLK